MMRALVVIGGTDNWHDLYAAGGAFQGTLIEAGIAAQVGVGLGRFANPLAATRAADVFVLYTMGHPMTEADQEAMARTVAEGKGLVVLHASNVLTHEMGDAERHRTYFGLVGSRFTHHERFAPQTVRPASGVSHPITEGIGEFVIEDEPYQFKAVGEPGEVILVREASGNEPAGEYPVVYVKRHGVGRVCYVALGHDARSWAHPSFQRLVVQATLWAGSREAK